MEEFETLDEGINEGGFSERVRSLAASCAPWIMATAIINMVIHGLTVVDSAVTGELEANPGGTMLGIFIAVALNIVLLTFGRAMATFGSDGQKGSFNMAMQRQKNYWMFFGILCILILVLVAVVAALLSSLEIDWIEVMQSI